MIKLFIFFEAFPFTGLTFLSLTFLRFLKSYSWNQNPIFIKLIVEIKVVTNLNKKSTVEVKLVTNLFKLDIDFTDNNRPLGKVT